MTSAQDRNDFRALCHDDIWLQELLVRKSTLILSMGVGILEFVAHTGEDNALLTSAQLQKATEGRTASLDAKERYLPVHVNLAVAIVLAGSCVAVVLLAVQSGTDTQLGVHAEVLLAQPVKLYSGHQRQVGVLAHAVLVAKDIHILLVLTIGEDAAHSKPVLHVIEILCTDGTHERLILKLGTHKGTAYMLERIDDLRVRIDTIAYSHLVLCVVVTILTIHIHCSHHGECDHY